MKTEESTSGISTHSQNLPREAHSTEPERLRIYFLFITHPCFYLFGLLFFLYNTSRHFIMGVLEKVVLSNLFLRVFTNILGLC